MTAAVQGWKNVKAGPTWVPVLNSVESQYGIPADLLARVAYQESHFRPEIIDGTTPSSAGALGLMQLLPKYFTSVQVQTPFTSADTGAQIIEAADLLVKLYNHYNDWGLALAGYNDGQTNIDAYVSGARQLPTETANYVAQILADVPVPSASVPS